MLDAVVDTQAQDLVPLGEDTEHFRHLALILALHNLHRVSGHHMHLVADRFVSLGVHANRDLTAVEDRPLATCAHPALVLRGACWGCRLWGP